jgi:hypothetical protein
VLSQNYASLRIKLKPADITRIQGSGMTQTVQFLRTRDVARVRLAVRDLATGRVGTLEVPVVSVSDSR